jgi:glycosyltransferase involved in cell wall biosynthesis
VLVVDDGSTDGTAQVAEAEGATVLRHGQNQGKGAALLTGFRWALEKGFLSAVTLDADGQHDPDEIPRFLTPSQAGADLLIGRRDFSRMPIPRRWVNPFGSWLLSLALQHSIEDNQCGYRLHRRRLLESLDLSRRGFELEVEVIVQAVVKGFHVQWIDIRTIYDTGKVSYFHPLLDSLRFLRMVGYAYQERRGARGPSGPGGPNRG